VMARYNQADIVSLKRDAVEVELKNELERIFYPRGIYVESVLLSEITAEAVKHKKEEEE